MTNSEKVCKFLDETKVFYLSTIEGDKPHVRPMAAHKLVNDKVYFQVGNLKNSYKQLQANPNCELVSYNTRGEWIRISGKAIFEKDFTIADLMMKDSEKLKDLYEKNGWKAIVFHIEGKVEIINVLTLVEKFDI